MKILLHPAYLPTTLFYSAIVKAEAYTFEACDNFQKQTFRNRTFIYGANGKLQLNVPIRHSQNNRQLFKDVKIAYDTNWPLLHKRSIESAYSTSPFFEFYQDSLLAIFNKKETFLYDLNLFCHEVICDCLDLAVDFDTTQNYQEKLEDVEDGRFLINAKNKTIVNLEKYHQVFQEKYGFIGNLSVVDLICNEGPNSVDYLKRQQIN